MNQYQGKAVSVSFTPSGEGRIHINYDYLNSRTGQGSASTRNLSYLDDLVEVPGEGTSREIPCSCGWPTCDERGPGHERQRPNRTPTPAPLSIRGHFTPIDSESDLEEIDRDRYMDDVRRAVEDLITLCAPDWTHKLDMQIPSERFETHFKLRVDPDDMDPRKRFSLHVKAVAKEPETESESESEEESDSSEETEIIHGYVSGNEGDSTW